MFIVYKFLVQQRLNIRKILDCLKSASNATSFVGLIAKRQTIIISFAMWGLSSLLLPPAMKLAFMVFLTNLYFVWLKHYLDQVVAFYAWLQFIYSGINSSIVWRCRYVKNIVSEYYAHHKYPLSHRKIKKFTTKTTKKRVSKLFCAIVFQQKVQFSPTFKL